MPTPKPKRGRRNVPLYVTMPPAERARVAAFADKVGRPLSWAVRDALTAYLDTVEVDADAMPAMKAAARVDPAAVGQTKQGRRGRPRKAGYGNPTAPPDVPTPTADELQALLAVMEPDTKRKRKV